MPSKSSGSLLRQLLENAFEHGAFAVVDEILAPGSLSHTAAWGVPPTREGLKRLIALFRSAFPDLHCTVEDEIRSGDKLAAHWTLRGTHTGAFLGHSPTNRPFVVKAMSFARIENGQIAENWMLFDQMSILQQLGIVPPAGC